jgi:5S rRNA maturation endonuclease (ribonuclease M5)
MTDKKTTKKSHSSKKLDAAQLGQLERECIVDINELFDTLGIDRYTYRYNRIDMPCPIHGGDNDCAVNFYTDGHTRAGHWVCNTHNCQETFKPTLLGFVRGVLSHERYGWEGRGDNMESFPNTINYLMKFAKKTLDDLEVDSSSIEKRKFQSKVNSIFRRRKKMKAQVNRQTVRSTLQMPCAYYMDRGYSQDVLDKYDVGIGQREGTPMYGRAVVPIYDDKHHFMIGCTARALDGSKPKWIHSKGFDADMCLYNYWFAKEHIEKTGVAILVEGPGDVWRLEENGIHNAVAMFGTYLSDGQKDLLDMAGTMSLIVLTDNDEAGKAGAEKIMKQCNKTYRLFFPSMGEDGDVGEMNKDVITSDIKPILDQVISTVI